MSARDDFGLSSLRLPPVAREAEQGILGALMFDGQAVQQDVLTLPASAFHDAGHRAVFEACLRLLEAGRQPDLVSVWTELGAAGRERAVTLEYVNALSQSAFSTRNVARYAAAVRDAAALRQAIALADRVAESAFKAGANAAAVLDQAAGEFAALQRGQVAKKPRSIAEIAVRRTEHYDALERGEIEPGWSTGLARLDALLGGGLRPGGLYVLAARPGVGKSSFALALAVAVAKAGRAALFLSQEMPDEEVADRAVVHVGRIDYGSITAGRMSGDDWTRASEALDRLAQLPLYVDDQPGLTVGDVAAKARAVPGVKVVVLDYLQLCAGSAGEDNRNAQIEAITRSLKALAKREQIAVVCLSQLNRQVETRANREPVASDLRDSGSIEQDADVVLMLWPTAKEGVVGCKVEKNRQGKRGRFALGFNGSTQAWFDTNEDIDARRGPRAAEFE